MSFSNCKLITFPRIRDPRGNLTFVENSKHIPFDIKRVFYIYDVPGGESRGEHANIETEQVLIAMSGSFDIVVDTGSRKKVYHLNRAYKGLYIPKMIWRGISNFSSGAVCLVLASTCYNQEDYIRDYNKFKEVPKHGIF